MGEVSFERAQLNLRRNRNQKYSGVLAPPNMSLPKSIATAVIALAAFTFFLSIPAHAQSCALCYTQAASSGSRMIQALKSGILVLIAPPTLMSVGVIFVCYRKRNQTMKDNNDESERDRQKHDSEDSDKDW
jgi:hypothetical protein